MANTQPRDFACLNCGTPYKAHPPDDYHNIASLQPCSKGDSIEVNYECQNCDNKNKIHWDVHHPVMISGSFSSDVGRNKYDDFYGSVF